MDFKYANPAGVDEVQDFIKKWFKTQPEDGQKLRAALDEAGKERIKDLAKNPLRLTLLCNIWNPQTGLPDTQANLYGQFVDKLYDWKADKFPEANLKPELNRAMGDLAKQGLNRANLRFRFTQAELEQFLPSLIHRKALTDLGWLNCVGVDESNLPVYAFFHPTFQEYFAACSINDWDYFLPKDHKGIPIHCKDEDVPTYRVFEQEWRQTILLWIGRGDVGDELKEKFIEKLTNFQEQEGEFYYYRAYCMAAICVGEFNNSKLEEKLAKPIVQQIVKWACVDWSRMKNFSISLLARETIPFTHRSNATVVLIKLLDNSDLDDSRRYRVVKALGKIAIGSETAIVALVKLLDNSDLDDSRCYSVVEALGIIAKESETAIATLVKLLNNSDLDDSRRYSVVEALGTIAKGSETAIATLVKLLDNSDLDDSRRYRVAEALGKITIAEVDEKRNEKAIAALITLLDNPDLKHSQRSPIALALGEIAMGHRKAIVTLFALLENLDLDRSRRYGMALALGKIAVGNEKAITTLVALFDNPDLDDTLCHLVANGLGKIAVGNEKAIIPLVALLNNPDLDNLLRSLVAGALREIAVGNGTAITTLVALLDNPELDDSLRFDMAAALGRIEVGNETAITTLVALLDNPDLNGSRCCLVPLTLGSIAVGNEKAITALVTFLANPDLDESRYSGIAMALGEILSKAAMPSTIWNLKQYMADEVYQSNYNQFSSCFKIIWQCAQTLSYPEFHTAWHPPLPTIPTNLKNLPHQLTHPNTIYIPHSTLHHLTQPHEIAQELAKIGRASCRERVLMPV